MEPRTRESAPTGADAPAALFVYGTLKRGQPNSPLLARYPHAVEPAWTRGLLYDLGAYPALVAGEGTVRGELVRPAARDLASLLALLDRLEDYRPDDPAGSLYLRRPIEVWTAGGARAWAYAYLYNRDHRGLRPIAAGEWTGPAGGRTMKLVYAADPHGEAAAYEALADLARDERADVVLLGGDLFAYSREAAPQLAFAAGPFHDFLRRLRALAIPVLAIAGNVDRPAAIARLREFERAGLLRLLGPRPHRFAPRGEGALAIVGYPLVPPTPFRLKDHERRDLAADRYGGPRPILISSPAPDGAPVAAPDDRLDRLPSMEEDLAAMPPTREPTLLVAHSPPWGCALDLTETGAHAGSRALRRWIEVRQPLLALHGHLHEAPDLTGRWAERCGATICVNPGPAAGTPPRLVVAETAALSRSLRHTRYGDSGL